MPSYSPSFSFFHHNSFAAVANLIFHPFLFPFAFRCRYFAAFFSSHFLVAGRTRREREGGLVSFTTKNEYIEKRGGDDVEATARKHEDDEGASERSTRRRQSAPTPSEAESGRGGGGASVCDTEEYRGGDTQIHVFKFLKKRRKIFFVSGKKNAVMRFF